jgi:alpha-galactosidase
LAIFHFKVFCLHFLTKDANLILKEVSMAKNSTHLGSQSRRGTSRRRILAYAATAPFWPTLVRANSLPTLPSPALQNGIAIEFDRQLRTRIRSRVGGASRLLTDFDESEYVIIEGGRKIVHFAYTDAATQPVNGELGPGQRHMIRGISSEQLEKTVVLFLYDRYPTFAIIQVSYRNLSSQVVNLGKWVNGAHLLKSEITKGPAFWSWHGASHEDRRDWVRPVDAGFEQRNFMGMNASDYGSGTPVVDVWHRTAGLAVGHLETAPKLVALPVSANAHGASMQVEFESVRSLAAGDSFSTFETFVAVHQGDYFATLANYRAVMADKGLRQGSIPSASYEPVWCAWGYDRNFNTQDIVDTFPKAKALGLKWAGLDDGWQTSEGDWRLDKHKFPRGDASMAAFAQAARNEGLKPKLWISPLAVDPGTDLLHDHTDMLLLNQDGAVQNVSWWNSFYLCPAYQPTIDYTIALVRKILTTWGYDGLKIDGQHLNGVAPCYNPLHNHARPEDSFEKLQDFWKAVYDTARSIKPDVVVEICPCGTSQSFFNMPYMNQAVGSDPLSSWQVRLKGKSLKALMGSHAPYCGDHVELSDGGNDFASSVGIGAVVATKFTLPGVKIPEPNLALTPEKEMLWARWIKLYNDKMLPAGTYRGELYDIGFDKPEAHVVEKNGILHYAFYAKNWSGAVEFRGLTQGRYRIIDYWQGKQLGEVSHTAPSLQLSFDTFLLVAAEPLDA